MGIELAGFIAATGIVAGVLVVWAQLWGSTASGYADRNEPTSTAEVGLAVSYLGALASLLALVLAIVSLMKGKQVIPVFALWLFGFALLLTLMQVLQSLFSVTLRLQGEQMLGPTPLFKKALQCRWVRLLSMVLIFVMAACVLGAFVYAMLNV